MLHGDTIGVCCESYARSESVELSGVKAGGRWNCVLKANFCSTPTISTLSFSIDTAVKCRTSPSAEVRAERVEYLKTLQFVASIHF